MKKLLALVLAAAFCQTGEAQLNRYIIRFRDKGSNPFSLSQPAAYLSPRAVERRARYGIAIDSTDLPVTPRYIDSVRLAGNVTILNVSKWLNAVTIRTTDAAALARINSLPFVVNSASIAARINGVSVLDPVDDEKELLPPARQPRLQANAYNYGASATQINMHNGAFLHNLGLRGEDMHIGMLDGGYNSYLSLQAFDSVRRNGQILDTWDFVAREASVNEDDAHGMHCFSVIAANLPGAFVGSAPQARFYLYRTEDDLSEFPIEEHNWVCGAERIDSAGGDLISSSLGYSDGMTDRSFNHTYAEMNGTTTLAARGAALAVRKGLLVVNAAGNQGAQPFKRISTPADADSVLAVGAVNSQGFAASFSSLGPSSDGQVKPDVASLGVGTSIYSTSNTVSSGNGTSYAAPNISGLAACLWQGFRSSHPARIVEALRQAGNRRSNPNDSIGYGIPDVKKAVLFLLKENASSTVSGANCTATLRFTSKDKAGMRYEVERKGSGETSFRKVGEVAATGSVFAQREYQFIDTLIAVQAGELTYRIRQVIDTAAAGFAADYIDTVSLNLTQSCLTTAVPQVANAANYWQLRPNPVQQVLTLQLQMPEPMAGLQIRIADARGQQVLLLAKNKPAGAYNLALPVGLLARGEYFVSISHAGKWWGTQPFLKL